MNNHAARFGRAADDGPGQDILERWLRASGRAYSRGSPGSRAWLVQAGAWLGRVAVLAAYWQDATTASGHNACPAPKMRSARPA
jgi:hypothetical protein